MSTTVRVLDNTLGTRSGTEKLPEVFLRNNCEQIDYHNFFCLSHKEEMRSRTHFTQQNVLLLVKNSSGKHRKKRNPQESWQERFFWSKK
jgi:hypothetical protein